MTKLAVLLALLTLPVAPTRYVSDPANLLDDGRERALNERLAQYERETSNQLLVYVDRSVPAGTTLEEMSAEAIRTWKVGQEKKDNGAILFLFVDDRASRIEVGYGLEGVLTDARSKRILVSLRDDLRAGDYISAVERGADQMIATIVDPSDPPPEPQPAAQEARAVESTMNGPPLPFYLAVFGFLGVILFVWYKVRRSEEDSRGLPSFSLNLGGDTSSSSYSSSDDWSSSSSSSSSSDSGFSGGGGDGGGGGASDRW